ncbi:MAG: hypothetical protein K6A92_03760 [Lachnospiraceae bacterium]|nr:hypothetical protein [Lachnospiraceae bacterium]
MKKTNNVLDERQEADLLKIERSGCWLAFWGLLIAIVVQTVIGTTDIIGEWIVFMCLCLYMVVECLRKGIWARSFKPSAGSNLMFSVIGAVAFGIVTAITAYFRKPEAWRVAIMCGVFACVLLFIVLFITLSIAGSAVKKQEEKLNAEPENEDK